MDILAKKEFKAKVESMSSLEYMCDEQVAVFKEHLIAIAGCCKKRLADIAIEIKDISGNLSDVTEQEEQIIEQRRLFTDEQNNKDLITRIKDALKAITEGDYGFCKKCGAEIGLGRLVAVPFSLYDFDCESLNEIKQRSFSQ